MAAAPPEQIELRYHGFPSATLGNDYRHSIRIAYFSESAFFTRPVQPLLDRVLELGVVDSSGVPSLQYAIRPREYTRRHD
jgi:hypothetical protein